MDITRRTFAALLASAVAAPRLAFSETKVTQRIDVHHHVASPSWLQAVKLIGADDPVIPASAAKDTAQSIPGAELVIVPGMSHDFPAGLVPIYLKHVGDFVAKVEAAAAAAAH